MRHLSIASFVLFALSLSACTAAVDDDAVGSASVAITSVPSDVACITLTATGTRTVTRNYDVVSGQSSVLALNGLPVGTVSFRGDAYTGACSTVTAATVPTFIAEPVDAAVTTGGVTPVTLMMRRNGQSSVAVDWEDQGTTTTRTLTVARTGSGSGTVTSMPTGINCGADCSESFADGTVLTLTAVPSTGSTFAGWSGGGCSGTGSCVVTMTAATTVTATYVSAPSTLSVSRAGTGTGTVISAPAGINCGPDCSESFPSGTVINLNAMPAAGSQFVGWSGGGCTGTGSCTVTLSASTNVTANFALAQHTLNVNKVGNGTVTGPGINCGADCSEIYPTGTMVSLNASPAPFGTFLGWGGACTGTGSCVISMNSAATVTANFSP